MAGFDDFLKEIAKFSQYGPTREASLVLGGGTTGLNRFPNGRPGYTPLDLYRVEQFRGQFLASYEQTLVRMVDYSMDSAVRLAAATMLTYLEQGFANGIKQSIGRMLQDAAFNAQQVVIDSYKKNVEGKRKVPSYARPGRYAGGMMQALSSPSFFTASANGVSFGNVAELNSVAKQWARLNYGAGAKGGEGAAPLGIGRVSETGFDKKSGTTFAPNTSKSTVFTDIYRAQHQAQFESYASHVLDLGPRPAFTIPWGVWFEPGTNNPAKAAYSAKGSTQEFYPMGQALPKLPKEFLTARGTVIQSKEGSLQHPGVTAGIAPRRFFDAGVRALYVGVEQGTLALVQNQFKLALERGIGAEAKRRQVSGDVVVDWNIRQVGTRK